MALALFHSGFTMWLRVRNPEPHGSTRNEPGAAWLNPEQNLTMDSAPPVPVGDNPDTVLRGTRRGSVAGGRRPMWRTVDKY